MKRLISTALAAGLTLGTFALAQPALAITNPADNPNPITVKGDDGKTYTDGEDTLPGYDDEACTYIPGAYFDFDNNKVRYADGQSITWTEWDRATGYKEWKAKQSKPATPAPTSAAPKPAKTTAPKPKPAPAKTTAPAPKSTSKPAAAKVKASATPSPTASTDAPDTEAASTGDEQTAPDDATATTDAQPAPADAATDEPEDVDLASETTDAKASPESGGTGSAGLLILGALAGAGLLAVGGYSVVSRRKGSAS